MNHERVYSISHREHAEDVDGVLVSSSPHGLVLSPVGPAYDVMLFTNQELADIALAKNPNRHGMLVSTFRDTDDLIAQLEWFIRQFDSDNDDDIIPCDTIVFDIPDDGRLGREIKIEDYIRILRRG